MLNRHTTGRLAQWFAWLRPAKKSGPSAAHRRFSERSRSLRMEPLEDRALLSVSGIGSEAIKSSVPFTAASSKVTGSYNTSYQNKPTTVNFTSGNITLNGSIAYSSLTDGVIPDSTTIKGNGNCTSMGYPGQWYITSGHTVGATDHNGVLTGSVVIQGYVQFPGNNRQSLDGTYTIQNGTFNASNFTISLDAVCSSGSLKFQNGTFTPKGNASVNVTPAWNPDGTIDVGVSVPGAVLKSGATRTAANTYVQVYYGNGSDFAKNKLGNPVPNDNIPVYWNERTGDYTIADLPAAPIGATHLLFVTMSNGKVLGPAKALALPTTVTIASANMQEGNSSAPASENQMAFTVTLSKAASADVKVWYTTFQGAKDTAKPNVDYVPKSGYITIAAGQKTGQILVPIIGNTTYQLNRTFSIKLTQAQVAASKANAVQALGTIRDDDPRPTISIDSVAALEGPSQGSSNKTTAFVFTVSLSNSSYQAINVNYATANGTATTADKDYQTKTGVLTFNAGATQASITVLVNADAKVESDETFFVNLSNAKNATLKVPKGTGTISNDDGSAAAKLLTASRNAALSQFAGPAELASYFDGLQQNDDEDASRSILATP